MEDIGVDVEEIGLLGIYKQNELGICESEIHHAELIKPLKIKSGWRNFPMVTRFIEST